MALCEGNPSIATRSPSERANNAEGARPWRHNRLCLVTDEGISIDWEKSLAYTLAPQLFQTWEKLVEAQYHKPMQNHTSTVIYQYWLQRMFTKVWKYVMGRNVLLAVGYSAQVAKNFLSIIPNIVATLSPAQSHETSCLRLPEYCKMWPKALFYESRWASTETISIHVKFVMLNLFSKT